MCKLGCGSMARRYHAVSHALYPKEKRIQRKMRRFVMRPVRFERPGCREDFLANMVDVAASMVPSRPRRHVLE